MIKKPGAKTLDEHLQLLREKSAQIAAKKEAAKPVIIEPSVLSSPIQQQLQLPFFGTDRPYGLRSVPNSILRSALFGAIQRGRRKYQQRVKKASVDSILVIHTGPTLDQADLDVWLQCLELARVNGVDTKIFFSARGFLKSIDRAGDGRSIEWLKGAFLRLSSSVVEIQDGKKAYFGPMLIGGARDDETDSYVLKINPNIVALFGVDSWSSVENSQRKALRNQPLAQWLHGFYTSHAKPWPYHISTIHKLCGSENVQMAGFKRELGHALKSLESVTNWTCEVDEFNVVNVKKTKLTRTKSQNKHLTAKGDE